MNSLLQSLYMTPEFRRALYAWTYIKEKDGVEQDCIPLQLQKIFGALQLSKSRDIDTKALTKSFGWESGEVFQQQDIQELCRVLFDALEETFRGTSLETVIDDIYAGQIVDYVKCLDVEYSSERCDKVQDFSLAIRPYGSTLPVKSLDEAIMLFLKPEVLDGDNQYFVESASRKSDAIKGLKIGRIPYVLTFQLKRFVYDFSTGDVVQKKLNDCVSFPMFLDMNKYLARSADEKRTSEEVRASV
jgi:ubiquitin carboxyl-terminal hydrolase 47